MKHTSKLLLIAACLALAVSLILPGNASSLIYRSDGLVQDPGTGEWIVEDPGQCYVRDDVAPGGPYTGTINPAGTDRTACRAIISPETTQADCTAPDATNPHWAGRWSGGVCTGNAVWNTDYAAYDKQYRDACLHCHDGMGVSAGTAAKTKNYRHTGHKNMLRKVTPGVPHLGPDGTEFATDTSGNAIDWLSGMINVGGTDYTLLWIYEGWIGGNPRVMYQKTASNNGSYSCGRCHATGTSIDSVVNVSKEPETSFPGITGTGIGQTNLALGVTGYTSDAHSSWDQWGIQCSRCHNSAISNNAQGYSNQTDCETNGYTWVFYSRGDYCAESDSERPKWNPDLAPQVMSGHHGEPTDGPGITRMCGECHRQETGGLPYTWVGTNNGTPWDKGFGDQAQTVIGGLSHGSPSPAVSHNYMNVFLNSPHARYTGDYAGITDIANYDSDFMAAAGLGEPGCMGCHNIHMSIAVEGHEPLENECTDCHSAAVPDGFSPQVNLATINHLGGAGTPLEDAATSPNHACEICHMTDHYYHFMRISTDPNYTTKDNYSVTGPDNTADDNGYADAVWLDVDIACGQCHGGGTNSVDNPPLAGMPYRTKAALAAVAEGMHDSAGVSYQVTFTRSVTPNTLTVNVDATVSGCGACAGLTYDWNWGDGTANGSGDPASHTYATAGTKTIKLTVSNADGTVGSATRTVTLATVDLAPVAAADCTWTPETWTMEVTDISTDDGPDDDAADDASPSLTIQVNWGDNSTKAYGSAGGVFSRVYNKAGTFPVSLKAIDSKLQSSSAACVVDATPTYFVISGTVIKSAAQGGGILTNANVKLKTLSGSTVKSVSTKTTGTFSFGKLKPGTYKVEVKKTGYTFPADLEVTVGLSSTGNTIQALTP